MIRIGLDTLEELEQHHQELIKESEQYRMLKEKLSEANPKRRGSFKVFALIGKEMASLGFRLEQRSGSQTGTRVALNQPGNPGGCS